MNPHDDPRYQQARQMRRDGHSIREISAAVHVRQKTCCEWVSDIPASKVTKRRKVELTPEPYILGFRWFGCRWR